MGKRVIAAYGNQYGNRGEERNREQYEPEVVDHAVKYVIGRVHTNGLENFWSLFKRCITGTYIALGPQHIERYLDEETFRFNNCKDNDGQLSEIGQ